MGSDVSGAMVVTVIGRPADPLSLDRPGKGLSDRHITDHAGGDRRISLEGIGGPLCKSGKVEQECTLERHLGDILCAELDGRAGQERED